jgi:8-oxo-dGTP diphosphatase
VTGPALPEPGTFALTADLAIFTIHGGVFSVLLVQRGSDPFRGQWALPGGFVHPDESVESAAWRELALKTSMPRFPGHLEQLRTYGDAGRDPRMRAVSVAHVAFAPDLPDPTAGGAATGARWWPVDDVEPDAPVLAFDHAEILRDATERVRSKLEYTTLATRFVAEPFTLSQLYRVYQAVWEVAPDLPTFRRKVLSTNGFVVPVAAGQAAAGTAGGSAGDSAQLYRRGPADVLQPAMLRSAPDETDERE